LSHRTPDVPVKPAEFTGTRLSAYDVGRYATNAAEALIDQNVSDQARLSHALEALQATDNYSRTLMPPTLHNALEKLPSPIVQTLQLILRETGADAHAATNIKRRQAASVIGFDKPSDTLD
jgi:hypothetical protein